LEEEEERRRGFKERRLGWEMRERGGWGWRWANEASARTLAGVGRLCPSVEIWVTETSRY
jgi:hypothetical protein